MITTQSAWKLPKKEVTSESSTLNSKLFFLLCHSSYLLPISEEMKCQVIHLKLHVDLIQKSERTKQYNTDK